MKNLNQLKRLKDAHELICTKSTGTPGLLAKTLKISNRYVYCLLEHLSDLGAQVGYSRKDKTYFYKNEFNLEIRVLVRGKVKSNEIIRVEI